MAQRPPFQGSPPPGSRPGSMFPAPFTRLAVLGLSIVVLLFMAVLLRERLQSGDVAVAAISQELAVPSGDRKALVSGLFQGALTLATDGEDFAETPSYQRLVHHVRAMPPQDFSDRVTGLLDWKDAVEHPDQWRGEFVRVRGLIGDITAVKLHGGDPSIGDVWRGFIGQTDGTDVVAFDSVEPPPSDLELKRTVVEIEGVFYRTVRYESKKDAGVMREVPYIIVRGITPWPPAGPRPSLTSTLWKIAFVVAASVAVALLALRWSERRRSSAAFPPLPPGASFKEMFEARAREDQSKSKGQAKPK